MIDAKSYKLLLIDDDEDEYILTRDLVNDMQGHHKLDWVDQYETGIKWVLQGAHDVYFVDYFLGDKTGVDLLKAVRERGSRAPVIILTGLDDNGIDLEALEAGATDYLQKSAINATLLERAIRYAVRQQYNQNRLEDLVQQVSHLEQLKTDMIRIAAHDLRNPLTVIFGYIDLLQSDLKDKLEPDYFQYLVQIKSSVEHMRQIVGDILSLERIAELSGGYTDPVDFSKIVREVYDRYATQATHDFELELPDETVIVYGAKAELREAVANLLSNAVKYTPENGRIVVHLSVDADVALFTVTDNGYGIPLEMQDKLFQPFYRAKSKETRMIDGTGLGLHLVKNIIERHNGHIHFESEYLKGSTFGFMLPQVGDD